MDRDNDPVSLRVVAGSEKLNDCSTCIDSDNQDGIIFRLTEEFKSESIMIYVHLNDTFAERVYFLYLQSKELSETQDPSISDDPIE